MTPKFIMSTNSGRKICYVCCKPYPGPNMEYFSQVVAKSGYDVTMVTLEGNQKESYAPRDQRKFFKIRLPGDKYSKKSMLFFISSVVQFLNVNNFNIVHLHSSCPWFGLIKFISGTKAKFIYHSMSFPLQDSKFERQKKMLVISAMARFMDTCIFQSVEAKNNWLGMRGSKKTVIIPVGFSNNAFCPADAGSIISARKKLGIEKNQIVIVFTGALSKFRKLDKLLIVFKRVITVCPEARLVMIGDGNDKKDLETLVVLNGLENCVIFIGQIQHKEVRRYLFMADIGLAYVPINESYTYNPPLKTFEYLACGLPTIATRTISNSVIIKEGYNGVLVNDTADDIADSIIDLIQDKDKTATFRKNANKSIQEYEFEVIVKNKLIPFYESLIS